MVLQEVPPVIDVFLDALPRHAVAVHQRTGAGGGQLGHEMLQKKRLVQQLLIPCVDRVLTSIAIETIEQRASFSKSLDVQALNGFLSLFHRVEHVGVQ